MSLLDLYNMPILCNFVQFLGINLRKSISETTSSLSRKRAWIFALVLISASASAIFAAASGNIIRYYELVVYYTQNRFHWILLIVLFMGILILEVILMIDSLIALNVSLATLYLGCLTIHFWLRQIWLGKNTVQRDSIFLTFFNLSIISSF